MRPARARDVPLLDDLPSHVTTRTRLVSGCHLLVSHSLSERDPAICAVERRARCSIPSPTVRGRDPRRRCRLANRSRESAVLRALGSRPSSRPIPRPLGLAGSGTNPLPALWRGSRPKPVKTRLHYTQRKLQESCIHQACAGRQPDKHNESCRPQQRCAAQLATFLQLFLCLLASRLDVRIQAHSDWSQVRSFT